jgi:beta-mannosidase
LSFYVVSDYPEKKKVLLKVTAMNMDGKIHYSKEFSIEAEPVKGKSYIGVPVEELLIGMPKTDVVVEALLLEKGRTVSNNHYFFAPFKKLDVSRPQITSTVVKSEGGLNIRISADKVATAIYLNAPDVDGFFSDNYFTLLPGATKEVSFKTKNQMSAKKFSSQLKIRSMVDAFK